MTVYVTFIAYDLVCFFPSPSLDPGLRGNSKWETVVKLVGFVKLAFVK